jgi:hypothetical protein
MIDETRICSVLPMVLRTLLTFMKRPSR